MKILCCFRNVIHLSIENFCSVSININVFFTKNYRLASAKQNTVAPKNLFLVATLTLSGPSQTSIRNNFINCCFLSLFATIFTRSLLTNTFFSYRIVQYLLKTLSLMNFQTVVFWILSSVLLFAVETWHSEFTFFIKWNNYCTFISATTTRACRRFASCRQCTTSYSASQTTVFETSSELILIHRETICLRKHNKLVTTCLSNCQG